MNGIVKSSLGLNATWSNSDHQLFEAQKYEFMKPVTKIGSLIIFADILRSKILIFSGTTAKYYRY